jgi:hypothetical protein
MDAPMKLSILQNEISQGEFAASIEVPVELTDSEKTQFSNYWRTFRERKTNLIKHQGQAFSLIQGQCTQLLQDKMKQDTDWNTVRVSYDPLTLYRFIERTVLAQTETSTRLLQCITRSFHFIRSSRKICPTRSGMNVLTPRLKLAEPSG